MSPELASELASLAKISDSDIDMSDLEEQLDWSKASIGKYYKPTKQPVSLRLDADVVDWFKSFGAGYQSKINEVLRLHVTTKAERGKSKEAAADSRTINRSAQTGAFAEGRATKGKKKSAQAKGKKRIAGA